MRASQPSRTMSQDIPGTVERPPARHNMTINEANAYRLLQDPIDFAQNFARLLEQGELADILMIDVPNDVDDARSMFESLMEQAIERGEQKAIQEVFVLYTEFVTRALMDAREYGVAFGAILEQLRVGVLEISDLKHRGMTYGDVTTRRDMSNLRQKYNLKLTNNHAVGVASKPAPSSEGKQAAD